MAQWGGTEEADRGATCRPWLWERLTWAILTLGGLVSAGLVAWDMTGGAHRGDARAVLAGLLVYLALCALIVRVDRAMKRRERAEGEERRRRLGRRPCSVVDEAEAVLARARAARTAVSAGEGAAERVTLTTDDATLPAVAGIAALLHAQGYVVERRAFVGSPAEGPRRVVLLALDRRLPALVALLAPEPAPPASGPAPGLVAALVAALYPDAGGADGAPATLQLKGVGAFASVTARSGTEARVALAELVRRVRAPSWWLRPFAAGGERRIAYVTGRWYSE